MNSADLNEAEIDFFFREGYVIVKNVFTKDEVETLRNFFRDKFESEFWKISPFNSSNNINDLYNHFPELIDLVFKPAYIHAVKSILGQKLVCIPECCVHYNRYFDWHRDTTKMESFGTANGWKAEDLLIQSCIYLQDNKPEGGGLTLVPKSHSRKDRFVKMHHGNIWDRVQHKVLKMMNRSPFQQIERHENPVDVPSQAGDLLLFNSRLDHRATFLRGKNAKPIVPKLEKFAVFNTFSNRKALAEEFQKSIKSADEPYANFLKQASLPPALIAKAKALEFSLIY